MRRPILAVVVALATTAAPAFAQPSQKTPQPSPETPAPGPKTPAPGPDEVAPGPDEVAPGPDEVAPGPKTSAPSPDEAAPGPETERPGAAIDREIEAQNKAAAARGLVVETTRGRDGAHLAWAVLLLPERMLEAMFLPIGALVIVAERYSLPGRIDDLLSNDAGTIVGSPKFKISTGQGLGIGASLSFKSRLQSRAKLRLATLVEIDGDYELGLSLERRVASLEGRRVALEIDYENKEDTNYFGVGGGTSVDDERELGLEDLRARISLDLGGRDSERLYGTARFGFLRQSLFAGSGTAPPVGEPGDTVAPPPGFDSVESYATIGFDTSVDSRDTSGRTSQGYLLELTGQFMLNLADGTSNGVTATAKGGLFIPLAGRRRTLVLSVGAGVAESATGDSSLPYDALIVLGRRNHFAGYDKDRFRVTRAWWGKAEYRYPIWYMRQYPVVMTSRLFVDVGREGDAFADLVEGPVRTSIGAGVVLELYEKILSGVQLAGSTEGLQFVFTAGSVL